MNSFHSKLIPFKDVDLQVNLEAGLQLIGSNLKVNFKLSGEVEEIALPKKEASGRRVIGLWESTCFELFILNNETHSYYEFNFSPEGHWNAFFFPKKKAPLKEAISFKDIQSNQTHSKNEFSLDASIDMYSMQPAFWQEENMSVALTGVLESKIGLSYWAIDHLDKKPNFHNFDTFKRLNS